MYRIQVLLPRHVHCNAGHASIEGVLELFNLQEWGLFLQVLALNVDVYVWGTICTCYPMTMQQLCAKPLSAMQINYLGLQLVGRRELFKQNGPSMPEHGRTAHSLTAIYHLGHPATKFFFGFPFIQFFPYFFPTCIRQQILVPFIFLLSVADHAFYWASNNKHSLYFSKHIFCEPLEENFPFFWLTSAAHCFVWINCSTHTFKKKFH